MNLHITKPLVLMLTWGIFFTSCSSSDSDPAPPANSAPTVATTAATDVTQNSATSGGNVTADGGATITERGICWATTANPTTANAKTTNSGTTGTYTSNITGLIANTLYYVRAYATNSVGTAYGTQISFTTANVSVALPTVTTTAISAIAQTTASGGGNVTNQGGAPITARGICWATTVNPTIINDKTTDAGTTGVYTSSMTSLIANTTYYVRAYATNSGGTAYGTQVSFTTLANPTGPVGGDAICDGTQPTVVVNITSSTGKIWMDRNLGASRAATSSKDYQAYGCLYQWGRGNDGHASINWIRGQALSSFDPAGTPVNGSTFTLSTDDSPDDALFIANSTTYGDWRSPSNANLWQGVNGINNPCPTGYRVPTRAELKAEFTAYGITNATTAYNSIHKFVLAGIRNQASAIVGSQGQIGFYWTSISSGTMAEDVSFDLTAAYTNSGSNNKTGGHSVRCIKN